MESPWYIPILIVGFTTVQGLLNFGGAYLNAWVGGKLTLGLKAKLYEKLVEIEPSYFDKTTSGEVLFRFNSDAELACSGLLGNLKSFITESALPSRSSACCFTTRGSFPFWPS